MKTIKIILPFLFLLLILSIYAQPIEIPELTSPVTDLAGILSENEIILLKNKLIDFEKDSIGQIVILIISTTGEETIEEYSIRLAEKWKVGSSQNDNGLILLVAKQDRTLRIEIGYGLEEIITDAEATYIIDNIIVQEFKTGNFYIGIDNGINRLIGLLQNENTVYNDSNLSENDFSESNNKQNFRDNNWYLFFIVIITLAKFIPLAMSRVRLFILIIFILILLGLDLLIGYINNDFELAWLFMLFTGIFALFPLIINIFGTITGDKSKVTYSRSSSSSSWSNSSSSWKSSSSSYSSSSGGSYSSSSGYSGGGGSFGGGGASGSW